MNVVEKMIKRLYVLHHMYLHKYGWNLEIISQDNRNNDITM